VGIVGYLPRFAREQVRKRARANRVLGKEPIHRFSSDVRPLSRATH